jgi:hypothetical protein
MGGFHEDMANTQKQNSSWFVENSLFSRPEPFLIFLFYLIPPHPLLHGSFDLSWIFFPFCLVCIFTHPALIIIGGLLFEMSSTRLASISLLLYR